MKASELKASILQLAVSGKLVAQDPNDEPASVLLQRIQAEQKNARVKGKVLPAVSEDEQPFATPASWVWTRLGDIGTWSTGGTPNRTKTEYYFNGTIPWLKSGDLNDGFITNSDEQITDLAMKETRLPINKIGSLVVALYGATIGKTGLLSIEATTNQACCVCNIYVGIDNRYLNYYIISQRTSLKKSGAGRAQPNISKEKLVAYPVPLPPLPEQHRIVNRMDELMPLIEAYDREEQICSALEMEFPDALRQSILQYAVEGKLVPQKADEHTAAELLVKIRKERDALVKEGKIKNGKPLAPVSEEEKPFLIPENWEWVRLGDICEYIHRGKSPIYSCIKEIPVVAQKCIQWSGIQMDKALFIDPDSFNTYTEERYLRTNDLLWNSTGLGTLGRIGIYDEKLTSYQIAVADSHVTVIRPIKSQIDSLYLYYWFAGPSVQNTINDKSTGSTKQTELATQTIKEHIVPLPPLAEQHRIVERVEELMRLCDRL